MEPAEQKVIDRLATAECVVVLTGAGISAESGVPTFRGAGGLWRNYRPEDLATPQAFRRDPELVWEWYNWRRQLLSDKHPNPGHLALAKLEHLLSEVVVITQNVDGLHRAAGNQRVLELHGNILRDRCIECGEIRPAAVQSQPKLLHCSCGGLLRPDVVWFGEALPEDVMREAFSASRNADVFLAVGTSGVVYPAASLPEVAKDAGAFVVEVNPQVTPLSRRADVSLRGKAGDILPRLVEVVAGKVGARTSSPRSVEAQ